MKNFALPFLLLLVCPKAFTQDNQLIDSLQKELTRTIHDSSRASISAELCFQYRFTNTDSALQFGRQALKLSRQIHYKRGEARALTNIAFVLRDIGNLPDAMDYQFKALKISEDNHFDLEAGLSMIRLSAIYRDMADYPKALLYLRNSFAKHEKAGNQRGTVIAHMNLGVTYLDMNQLDSALYYEKMVYPMMSSLKLSDLYPNVFRVMGDIHKKSGNASLALNYYRQSIFAANSLRVIDIRTLTLANNRIAELYRDINQQDSCIYYAKRSLDDAGLISNKAGIIDAATLLSKVYEPIDLKQSYYYFKMATAAKDSLFNRDKFNALQTMTFEKEELDRSIGLEKKAYQDRIRLYGLLTGLGIFLFAALFLYQNNRQKQRTNVRLQRTLSDLKAAQNQLIQSEKMASLGELTAGIAHEIQNPLNFVNNFSEVSNELIGEMKIELANNNTTEAMAIADDLRQNLEKINHHGKRADAIVKGMLQHSRSNGGVKELTDINKLADEYLRLAYHGWRAKDKSFNVTLVTDYDETIGPIAVIPQDIGRVLLNLYNNAFYAVAENNSSSKYIPTVSVSSTKTGDKLNITVKDNGTGIPSNVTSKIFQPFFTTKPTGQGTGLGLSLSYDIIKSHGGEIKVKTQEGEMTEFIILLPIQ